MKPLVRIAKKDLGVGMGLRRWTLIDLEMRTDDGDTELYVAGDKSLPPDASGREAVMEKLHAVVSKMTSA